jgi:phospholipid transport system substrate-binding protein
LAFGRLWLSLKTVFWVIPGWIVRALIATKKGMQIPVESRLLQKADRWLIYDVLVENVSLIASYRSQFDRVIRTTSYEELVRRRKNPGTS